MPSVYHLVLMVPSDPCLVPYIWCMAEMPAACWCPVVLPCSEPLLGSPHSTLFDGACCRLVVPTSVHCPLVPPGPNQCPVPTAAFQWPLLPIDCWRLLIPTYCWWPSIPTACHQMSRNTKHFAFYKNNTIFKHLNVIQRFENIYSVLGSCPPRR